MRVILDRNRGGAYLSSLLLGIGLFGVFLFLTYYFQGTLHYSALKTGFAFLPFAAGIAVAAGLASQLLPRVGPRVLIGVGLAMGVLGLVWFTRIGVQPDYGLHVLPAELDLRASDSASPSSRSAAPR